MMRYVKGLAAGLAVAAVAGLTAPAQAELCYGVRADTVDGPDMCIATEGLPMDTLAWCMNNAGACLPTWMVFWD
jgi:uncharacterized membrane protein